MSNEAEEVKSIDLEIAPMEAITRAEVDIQIRTALAHPRSIKQFMARAEAMITIDEETAASCLYRLTRYDKRSKETKVIEGESIRMAEIVAACFGNLRSAVQISGYTPTRVSVRAVCHDLESNNLIAVEKQAKTAYSDGNPYNEDMAIMTANALVSKALRDAIFRVVPKALVKPLKEKARLVALGDAATFKARRGKAIEWAKTLKIDLTRVFNILGVKGEEDIGLEQLEVLTGLRTAIRDGDQTAEEAFPVIDATGSKPMMEHPEVAKKRAEEAAAKALADKVEAEKAEAAKAAAAKTEKAAPKKEKAPEPKPEPKPEAKVEEKKVEPPSNVVAMPAATSTVAPPAAVTTPAPEPDSDGDLGPQKAKPAAELTENQKRLKDELEGRGLTFLDLIEWGRKSVFNRPPVPTGWNNVNDEKAAFFIQSIKGIAAGIKKFKEGAK